MDPIVLECLDLPLKSLLTLVQRTNDVIVVTDKDGYITWVNQGFIDLTGYSTEECLGKKPGHLLQGKETDPDTIKEISDSLKQRKPIRTTILNYAKNGRKYWLHLSIYPVYNNKGELIAFVATEIDMTGEVMLKDNLIELSSQLLNKIKAKNDLMGIISHDIRNLLSGVNGLSDLLHRKIIKEGTLDYDNPGTKKMFKSLTYSARKMTELINQLSPNSQLNSRKEVLLYEMANVSIEYSSSIQLLKNITVQNLIPKPTKVLFVPDDLEIILRNLIMNAIKYSHPESKIILKIEEQSKQLLVKVQDFGVGIKADKLDGLLEFKDELSKTTTGTNGEIGSGFGLLMCRDLAERNGCWLEIESVFGQGTTVSLAIQYQ